MQANDIPILNKDGLTYLIQKVKTLINEKVNAAPGKGLSTNDFTNAYKNKIDELATNQVTVDSSLSTSSTNPVQNKIVTAALEEKVNKSDIDTVLSSSSTNPVQNKAVYTAINNKADKSSIPNITYGTIDLTANTSSLATGDVYLVYE